jgi:hypothetical protein
MSEIENFVKLEMVKQLEPQEIVDLLDRLDSDGVKVENKLKKAHEEIDRLKDEIVKMTEYEKIVDGVEG